MPGLLIDKLENEATPPFACIVTIPDNDPDPGFDPMATVTITVEPVTTWPDPFTTSISTGSPWEPKPAWITWPAAVSAGCPSLVNLSEQDPSSDPAQVRQDIDAAARAAGIAATSTPAASTPSTVRPTVKSVFRMAGPPDRPMLSEQPGQADRDCVPNTYPGRHATCPDTRCGGIVGDRVLSITFGLVRWYTLGSGGSPWRVPPASGRVLPGQRSAEIASPIRLPRAGRHLHRGGARPVRRPGAAGRAAVPQHPGHAGGRPDRGGGTGRGPDRELGRGRGDRHAGRAGGRSRS